MCIRDRFSTALPEVRLTTFLGMILILGYLNYPIKKGVTRVNYMPWYDAVSYTHLDVYKRQV